VPGGAAIVSCQAARQCLTLADTRLKIANNARVLSAGHSDSAAPGKAIAAAVGYFGRRDLMRGDPGEPISSRRTGQAGPLRQQI